MTRTVDGFTIGDHVLITDHDLRPYVGRIGTIKTLTEAANMEPTAWVAFTDHKGGAFALLSDLTTLRECDACGHLRPQVETLESVGGEGNFCLACRSYQTCDHGFATEFEDCPICF